MKIAFILPDDLSTIIFCKSFSNILHNIGNIDTTTISPVDMYRNEVNKLSTTHIEIPMVRYINPLLDLKYFIKLYRVLKQGEYDKVLAFTTKPNIYGVPAASLAGVKDITLAVRGMGRIFNEPTGFKDKVLLSIVSKLYRNACGKTQRVWFTNKHDLNYCVKNRITTKDKTFLTRNAVNLNDYSLSLFKEDDLKKLRLELSITKNTITVVMVARLIWSKGIREFCEAAVLLKKRNPNIIFLLVAPEEPNSPGFVPTSYVKEAEAQSNLKWLGFRKDVKEIYAISDLSVLPSYYAEGGYPRALLEAMAFGKPVIAGDTDVCRGPVEHGKNGYIVPVKDSVALSKAIQDIAECNERRVKFGNYSLLKMKNEFDDEMIINQVLKEIGII